MSMILSKNRQLLLVLACLATLAGCQQLEMLRSQSPDDPSEEDALSRVMEEEQKRGARSFVGDYASISGTKVIVLEGVGLITQLDGTGGDAPSTSFRKELLDEMRRLQVENPNKVLQSPSTAMVVVRAYLPPLIRKGEHFDVEVRLPEGSEATSLAGGWLLPCDLRERAVVPGRGVLAGDVLARAQGPLLISTGEADEGSLASLVKRGTIPGGAVSLREDRPLSLHLKDDFRSVRMANRITQKIGERFHDYDEYGIRRPLARFKTDSRIELEVHDNYRDNYPRYLQVIGQMAFNEVDVERHLRMQRLKEELLAGARAEQAALQLEAIGRDAIPVLKEGLNAAPFESKFHAAVALAYLGDSSGVDVLAEAAARERAFRVFAFAAMAALQNGDAFGQLVALMDSPSAETSYGAFRALTTLNPHDPAVRGELLSEQFTLHLVPTTHDPLVHVTRRRKAEVVLFGDRQRFSTPLAVNAGKHLWVTARPGGTHAVVSRYKPGEEDRRLEVPLEIAEVIRALASQGATYPDIVQMLVQAERQHNLPGRIAVDALPQAGRVMTRLETSSAGGSSSTAGRVGNPHFTPNLYSTTEESEDRDEEDFPASENSLPKDAPAEEAPAESPPIR
jgi:hypothetical protein